MKPEPMVETMEPTPRLRFVPRGHRMVLQQLIRYSYGEETRIVWQDIPVERIEEGTHG